MRLRILVLLVGLLFLFWDVGSYLAVASKGDRMEATLVAYKGGLRLRCYPVVEVDGVRFVAKVPWAHRWYSVGDAVPVIKRDGYPVSAGPWPIRLTYSILAGLVVISIIVSFCCRRCKQGTG